MFLWRLRRALTQWRAAPLLCIALMFSTACSIAGFGGSLQLNVTNMQSRELTIHVRGTDAEARVVEIDANGENELGTGSVEINRYVLQRATFGSSSVVGLFLCAKPCPNPLSSYVVAYSPDQLFTSDGELQLVFRIVSAQGMAEEFSRVITAEMLPNLWRNPTIETGPGS